MSQTRHVWVRDLLVAIGGPGTLENAVALVAQCQAEGGSAKFNPLNSTRDAPGATDYNSVHVKNYTMYEQGIDVTAQMLRQTNMRLLFDVLRRGGTAGNYWTALALSPWGTRPPVGYTQESWLDDVRKHWFDRAMKPITGT